MLIHPLLRTFLSRRMLVCVSLGFASGLPLFIIYNLLSAWLRASGVDLKAIGLFALVGFPYTWKFVWSPLMDRFSVPGVARLGRRRSWMLVTQVLLLLVVFAVGQFDPKTELTIVVMLVATLAFLSASQDIVIDAYRREYLPDEEQGSGTAIFVNAYKLSTLVPGSLALILSDHLPWGTVFLITALFMLPGIITTLIVGEPTTQGTPPKNLREAVVLPFREFVQRRGWNYALMILQIGRAHV